MDPSDSRHAEAILDEALVLRVREGSREAFELIARRWQERLWKHARRLVGNDDAAWEVLQESWLSIARGIPRIRDPKAWGSWAYTIVTRAATNYLRRRPRQEDVGDLDSLTRDATEASGPVASLRRALVRLPAPTRALLHLRYVEGFSVERISQILAVPEGTVKSRLYHARKRLAQTLKRIRP